MEVKQTIMPFTRQATFQPDQRSNINGATQLCDKIEPACEKLVGFQPIGYRMSHEA